MAEQREQVLNEVNRYADFCNRIQNNQATGSNLVGEIKKLNHQIGTKNKDKGYLNVMWQKLRNRINAHKIMWGIGLFIIIAIVLTIIEMISKPGNDTPPIFIPLIVTIVLLVLSRKPVRVPFIELREDEKTPDYHTMESQLEENTNSYNQLLSQFQAFANNVIINGFITQPGALVPATISSDGEYQYPYVSNELQCINEYLQKHQAETIHEASMLYTQNLAYENQVESNNQIIANTAEAAENTRRAANSARSASAWSAANFFSGLFK
jgi:hypothetical protein